jgi:pimeloyl-ACP methyl ester carboxylesterase
MSEFNEGYLGYFNPDAPASALTALRQLDAFIASHGPFEGVIAFSQGAQLAATYIVHKKLENHAAEPVFKCAILFSPLGIYDPKEWITSGTVRKMDFATDGYVISLPSLVVWGEKDQWKEESEGVSKLCDQETLITFVHTGGHEIPGIGLKEAVGPIAKFAKRCIMSST